MDQMMEAVGVVRYKQTQDTSYRSKWKDLTLDCMWPWEMGYINEGMWLWGFYNLKDSTVIYRYGNLERKILQRRGNQVLLFGYIKFEIGVSHSGSDIWQTWATQGRSLCLKKLTVVARIKLVFLNHKLDVITHKVNVEDSPEALPYFRVDRQDLSCNFWASMQNKNAGCFAKKHYKFQDGDNKTLSHLKAIYGGQGSLCMPIETQPLAGEGRSGKGDR